MDIEVFLSQSDYFKDISAKSKKLLADICLPKKLKKKEILFLEGNKGHALFFCASGNIQLYKTTQEGKEIVIKMIKPGEMFAEVILFEKTTYPVTAMAVVDSLVYMLPKHDFSCLLEREDFRNDFIATLMKKQRFLADQIKYLTSNDVEERLFLFLKEQFGTQEDIKLSMSKKDVALAIGTTPETLSRTLLRLKNEGQLVWDGNTIQIQNSVWQDKSDY